MREYLFDDRNSIVHAVLGFIVALMGSGSVIWKIIATILLMIYVVYEVFEIERSVATVGDVVEFTVGFMIGALWW